MKCQILFSGGKKKEKNISKCLLKFLPSMQSVKEPHWGISILVTGLSLPNKSVVM